MTTLPERLVTSWFSDTLTGTIAMCSRLGATLLLQVPVHNFKGARADGGGDGDHDGEGDSDGDRGQGQGLTLEARDSSALP